uniref:5-methyltetrahydropteroyltriglutamate--homocysteine methyltransferase (Fragments) n=1 Tax=Pseudotsuga menziesii TaxID=3357 RepID=METE_PSEMZ|nr:RecName: Full=5-methyltetrahydropteroyltriglutamate--homocysteine methyltransferase; AltName: Full=Cobalamin-independent methionine synthase isozyme; AltName: Full=Vitamin-B12-independent methionine synthase isozyme [Pseudotsuga menziesii]
FALESFWDGKGNASAHAMEMTK